MSPKTTRHDGGQRNHAGLNLNYLVPLPSTAQELRSGVARRTQFKRYPSPSLRRVSHERVGNQEKHSPQRRSHRPHRRSGRHLEKRRYRSNEEEFKNCPWDEGHNARHRGQTLDEYLRAELKRQDEEIKQKDEEIALLRSQLKRLEARTNPNKDGSSHQSRNSSKSVETHSARTLEEISEELSTSPFIPEIQNAKPPKRFYNIPEFTLFDGESDPEVHILHYEAVMSIWKCGDYVKCRFFGSSLGPRALRWLFFQLKPRSIRGWRQLCEPFVSQYFWLRNNWPLES